MKRTVECLTLSTLLLAAFVAWRIAGIEAAPDFSKTVKVDTELDEMQTITAEWVSDGVTITISTTRTEGEDTQGWLNRHKTAVDAAKVLYPPD